MSLIGSNAGRAALSSARRLNNVVAPWSAPAERSGDGALLRAGLFESGVELRLPPQSKVQQVFKGWRCFKLRRAGTAAPYQTHIVTP